MKNFKDGEELNGLRGELTDDFLKAVLGGNDDGKGKSKDGIEYTCPGCGKTWIVYHFDDITKHQTQECPANPYK